jgi:hypothetical protein
VRASDLSIHREFPSALAYSLAARRYDFQPVTVTTDTGPALPDGSLGITDRVAVDSAATALGAPGPGVEVAAQYGLLSAPRPAVLHPGGAWEPLYQDKPVWLVAFYGPGVNVPASLTHRERGVAHEIHALVDARTGTLLSIFN